MALKFHSTTVKSLNSSTRQKKPNRSLTLAIVDFKLDSVLFQVLSANLSALNLAEMILAASVTLMGADQNC